MTDRLIYVCSYIGMATVSETAAPCPACRSSRTRKLSMLSEYDSDFDFFMCGDCGHAWKEPKTAATPLQSPKQSTDETPFRPPD
jgi:Zn ribbon nucleic-acid-binding protein